MYFIEPYKSIGELILDCTQSEIEGVVGKGQVEKSKYIANMLVGYYDNGVKVEYQNGIVSFIGILISLCPAHLDFTFENKSYSEVLKYFKSYPGDIFGDDDIGIISEHLGISVYFYDSISQVGIFSKNIKDSFLNGLIKIT